MDVNELKKSIKAAHEAVSDEIEPYKLEAFKIILQKLLVDNDVSKIKVASSLSQTNDDVKSDLGGSHPITVLADNCEVTTDKMKNVFDLENDKFVLLKKIEERTDAKKQVVASHCMVTAYMKGMNKEWISAKILREMVDKNGLGKGGNLATNLANSGIFRIKGKGKGTEYSLTTEGWQEGLKMLKTLAQSRTNR